MAVVWGFEVDNNIIDFNFLSLIQNLYANIPTIYPKITHKIVVKILGIKSINF